MAPRQPQGVEDVFEVPKFDIKKEDVQNFIHELQGFHEVFADCFDRSESRRHFFHYLAGQFSPLERKSIEPIAISVEDGKVRPMQRFVSDASWDEAKIISKYRGMAGEDFGDPKGVLIF